MPFGDTSPRVALTDLDELWFQVSGTLCNLECTHCFISCSPKNDAFGYLSLETVERRLEESRSLGVKEYYFTGGEPFLNREMVPILEKTLEYGPATVLTNGTVLKPEWLERLRAAEEASTYCLEFRVSIDGPTPEINDPIRGERTFERAMKGVALLVEYGFLPIITMTRTWDERDDGEILGDFRNVLAEHGYTRARLKVLPRLKIGAEAQRTCGYEPYERVTPEMMEDYDSSQLICSHSRIVTDRGVHVCPILIDSPDSLMGATLEESLTPYPLRHGACYTCYLYGAICTNPSAGARE
ncbi:MAG: radical SAM protein [Planctomycetota bacterium]|nr:MAG: radical SAM protein [Planctomycetota bacterium]REK23634.1 MAG: radical SAM protein [Planctomycetota bacterium]REK31139.1 MAG: radical SAM protein [Planctomycetota bacterium]